MTDTTIPTLSLAQFIATGRDSADLGNEPGIMDYGLTRQRGRVYLGQLFIRHLFVRHGGDGDCWEVPIANTAKRSSVLGELEAALYEWAASEGYLAKPAPGADKRNVFQRAVAANSLDAGVRLIQAALRIDAGDVAGQHFAGADNERRWTHGHGSDRAAMLAPWLADELAEAGTSAGPMERTGERPGDPDHDRHAGGAWGAGWLVD